MSTQVPDNASSYHKKVYQFIIDELKFSPAAIRHEVPVQELDPSYPTARHRFDMVIPSLNLVIEVHGEQHYKPADFGGRKHLANFNLKVQETRDALKFKAANDAGYAYISIPFNEISSLTYERFYDIYSDALSQISIDSGINKSKHSFYSSVKDEIKEKNRELRKKNKLIMDKIKKEKKEALQRGFNSAWDDSWKTKLKD